MAELLLLFAHTGQGNKALAELVDAGVDHAALRVAGDLGPAASQPGAERHVTLDMLHVPADERDVFMQTIRDGGAVLGVETAIVDVAFAEQVGKRHGAMRISVGTAARISHNVS